MIHGSVLIVSDMQALQEQRATNHKHNLEYLLWYFAIHKCVYILQKKYISQYHFFPVSCSPLLSHSSDGVHRQLKQLTCPEIAVVSRIDHLASNYNSVSLLAPHMILLSTELNTMWILQLQTSVNKEVSVKTPQTADKDDY